MKIKIQIEDIQKIKDVVESASELLKQDLDNLELDLTEENINKAKVIKNLCSKGWIRADIKLVSSDGTELTQIR